jgi:hypothetical protein
MTVKVSEFLLKEERKTGEIHRHAIDSAKPLDFVALSS